MSSRYPCEQISDLRRDAPRFEPALLEEDRTPALLPVEDVSVATRSPARLLITASTPQTVEALARRIHDSGPRAQFPFVTTSAGELPVGAQAMREECVSFLDAAAGGSVLAPLRKCRPPCRRH